MNDKVAPSDLAMWTPGRIIATAVVGVLVATVGYFMFSSGRSRVSAVPDVSIAGKAAEQVKNSLPDFTIPTIDGRSIKLSDYAGKVLVVDFWATWCPPCRDETPHLARIARENGPRGVEVVGLHIDDRGKSSQQQIRDFAKTFGVPYTIGLATDEMFIAYLGRDEDTIPQTLVFGRDGKLKAHLVGYGERESKALDDAVNRALGGI
jgi:thiol-disulfide isomerase/thioredoxin